MIGRVAAIAAVGLAIVVVAVIVLSSGSSYQVNAVFQNASQIVAGDQVQVAGISVGSVSKVALTGNGLANLTLTINDSHYEPLHQGTLATVRLTSLSGIANRYIDLRMGPGSGPKIPNGGILGTENTTSAVDLDQLFNTLNAPTRKALQNVIQGSASQYAGRGRQMQVAWAYLNPAIASTAVLFRELNRDTSKFTRFITKSAGLVTDLAQRSGDLSALIRNLATTTKALASQRVALGQAIRQLPGFMALANTTFVNLRSALNDLTPLVNASKPVAPRLRVFLEQLRPLAQESVPTVRDLANVICSSSTPCTPGRPGRNDLISLTELAVPLAAATCGTGPNAVNCLGKVMANGKSRLAAFPISTKALNGATPELATARPYAADLTGWFEGFSHPGQNDANGATSRVASNNAGPPSLDTSALNVLTNILPGLGPAQQITTLLNTIPAFNITAGQGDRCPGSMERGGVWYPESGYPCNPKEVPTGP